MRAVSMPRASRSAPGGAAQQGTLGGTPRTAAGSPPGRTTAAMGTEVYLWILVILEVGVIAYFRATFSRYHGG